MMMKAHSSKRPTEDNSQVWKTIHRILNPMFLRLRSDNSTGPDSIPSKFIKLVAEHLVSPLTYIINTCLKQKEFPSLWKVARIIVPLVLSSWSSQCHLVLNSNSLF